MRLLLFLSIFISQVSLAQVKYLEKGEAAPYTGYLFTPEKETEVRQGAEALKYFKLVDETNGRIIKLKDDELVLVRQQSDIWRTQSEALSKELQGQKNTGFWKQTLYFGLGALLTTALAFGVNKATK